MLAALEAMLAVPVFPAATVIALVCVPAKPPFKVAFDDPEEFPIVIVPVPKAAAVVPLRVPALIVVPPS